MFHIFAVKVQWLRLNSMIENMYELANLISLKLNKKMLEKWEFYFMIGVSNVEIEKDPTMNKYYDWIRSITDHT